VRQDLVLIGTSSSCVVQLDVLVELFLQKWDREPTESETTQIREESSTDGRSFIPVHKIARIIPFIGDAQAQHIFKSLGPCVPESPPRSLRFDVGVAAHKSMLQCTG